MTPVDAIIAFLKENGHEMVETEEDGDAIQLTIGHIGKWIIIIGGFEIDICEGAKLNLHDPNSLPDMLEIMEYCASTNGNCKKCKHNTSGWDLDDPANWK